ncbi:MAG: MFS transporter [Lachnospiraceae bacterium]|nr:MFS transporter [Ruminococcus sp.]MCM1273858.1 MFS transporter [Lachnospiraceae bacterium]
MRLTYKHTVSACFLGYIVQAVINNFAPLLFLTFQTAYGVPLSQITLLIGFNFTVQLCVDLASAGFAERLGYRRSMLLAHGLSIAGFAAMGVLPEILPSPFVGLLIAVFLYAVGGGLLEVLVSPIVEACPTDNKERTMSILHSFYCWGVVAVIVLSTLFFTVFGIENWRVLAFIWALVPLADGILFAFVPISTPVPEGEGMSLGELVKSGSFRMLFVMMLCAGASEQAVSQWASTLCETALGVSKTIGDLAGTAAFAVLMGTARALHGRFSGKLPLSAVLTLSGVLCAAAYLLIALVPSAAVGLAGCALCGFAVGAMWPATFSKGAAALPRGGTMMFALFALAGDIGCALGPALTGLAADISGGGLRVGVLCAVIFPVGMTALAAASCKIERKKSR